MSTEALVEEVQSIVLERLYEKHEKPPAFASFKFLIQRNFLLRTKKLEVSHFKTVQNLKLILMTKCMQSVAPGKK